MDYEAIVIGGSYAGLSAALQLARARRRILVIDEGLRRNRFAAHSHGFLTQDGEDPAVIATKAWTQLIAYPTVQWRDGRVDDAAKTDTGFSVSAGGRTFTAKALVLATGVKDNLPAVEGLQERWGKSVYHCPYCHGYELNQGEVGVIASSPLSLHQALMLPDWGPTTFLLNDVFEPDEAALKELARRGARLEKTPIRAIEGHADVVLQDGRTLSFAGLFTMPKSEISSPIAEQLGCALEDGPMGLFIQTDMMKQTTIPGVIACGDAARAAGSVALAVGDGAMAGAATHRFLMFGA
ncbi:NAD(P)/FAD-dependent oxidoreductase [Rhizobium sp. XQZ8]|uniref:NAD(P)/FAD-dependent oxidoreductase n=1 Tax=Rhizobium populisoli TaxID=2859785 RepID=UPI001C678743|nr:NAD(P)/FAD-dependent oxidoreductase [Rhizobium populisoli]MBW6421114.1 NAD(P)/FAD-dependent oxidoreductase [Rhizobium populisoli]